ncbi:MFS transporter [Corynebacterium amycolatum]|nr:MFS transporter [Corynebacterium amycolatum]
MSLPEVSSEINAGRWYGWISGVYIASSTLFIPFAVKLLGIFGPRRIYSAAMLIWLAGTIWVASSGGALEIILARVVQGAGTAGLVPAGMEAASVVVGAQFGRFVSAMAAVQSVSIALGAPLGGLLSGPLGWRKTLWAISGLMFLALLIGACAIPRATSSDEEQITWREIWNTSAAKMTVAHSTLFAAVYFGLATFVPLLLQAKYFFGTSRISLFVLPILLGSAIGAMTVNKLGYSWSRLPLAWVVSAIGCGIVLIPSALFVAVGGAIASIGVGAGLTILLLTLKDDLHGSASAASGMIQAARNTGGAVSAVLLTLPIQLGASNEHAAIFACSTLTVVAVGSLTSSALNAFCSPSHR